MVAYPPPQPDDTQPTSTPARPTLPRRRPTSRRSKIVLLVFILGTALSLAASIALLFSFITSSEELDSRQIILVMDGISRSIETDSETVAELLEEERIDIAPGMILSQELGTLLVEGMVLTITQEQTVTVSINGEQRIIQTPYTNPLDILLELGIELDTTDRIYVDGTLANWEDLAGWPVTVNKIEYWQSVTVTIHDGDQIHTLQTSAYSVGDALYEAGITLYLSDQVTPDIGTLLTQDTEIFIDRALPIEIAVDGTVIETRVQDGVIADALTESGVALVGLDYSIPSAEEALSAGLRIDVRRVTERIESSEVAIPYETNFEASPELELDQRQVIQSGQNGIQRNDERIRFENGIEVGREPAGSEMIQAPRQAIIAYGTRITIRSIDTPEGPREYWRKLRVYATSYKPEALGGDDITAIGMKLQHGVIGADPRIIPYRTNMYVPGYGIGIMADTGGPRSSPYWIDLGYSDEDFEGWHWYVDLYLLTPVPANINYLLPEWRPMRGLPDNR